MPDIQNWYNEVQKTPLAQRLQNYDLNNASEKQREEIKYLGHPTELWACSYAQYIAQTSSYGELFRQVGKYCVDDIFKCRQWPEKDFEPVYEAVEQILIGRGWLR